jgi:flagellar hook-associated protein 2
MADTELSTTSTAKPNVLSSVNKNGSGMDLASVVTALVDAETVPQRVLTEKAKEATETSISAYGTLKGKVSDLTTNLTSLEASSGRTPFSDNSKVFISVIDETLAEDFISDVTISQLAAGQVLSFDLNKALSSTSAKASTTIEHGTYRISAATVAPARTGWETATEVSSSATVTGGNNLALVGGGTVTLSASRQITITSAGNDSDKTFTITGTDVSGNALSETVTGANAASSTSTNYFKTITSIDPSANPAGATTANSLPYYDIVINSTNNTAEGLKKALNDVAGVGAEIIDSGAGGLKLLIKSESGTDNALAITSTTGDTQFVSATSTASTAFTLSNLSRVKSGNSDMATFGVALSSNVLTVTGDDPGGAGTLAFDLTTTLGEKLEISVEVTGTDTRRDVATKIEAAIDTAVAANTMVTTATTTLAAGTIAASGVTAVDSTVTFSSVTEQDLRVLKMRSAQNASFTIDGITVSRSSNVIEDLYPGHQIVLTGTTAHQNGQPTESFAIGSANTNSAAKSRFQDFITHINDLKTHLNEATEKGILGGVAGDLAGDTAARTILRRLSSFTTQPIGGFDTYYGHSTIADGTDKPIYLAEMGVRTKIDGTLELYDEDRFDAALADNPNVLDPIFNTKFSSSSSAFSVSGFDWDPPDVGSYAFAYAHSGAGLENGTATLNGVAMTSPPSVKNNIATFQSAATDTSDPTYGLQVTVLDTSISTASVRYGRSLLDTIKAYATDLLGYANDTDNKLTLADREVELQTDITEADATLAEIEAKVTELTDRYNTQFAAMEAAVTSFNATGEYMKTLFESWNNQNK